MFILVVVHRHSPTPEVIIVIVVGNETFTCLSFHEMMLVFGNVLALLILVSSKVQPHKKNNQKDQPKNIRVKFWSGQVKFKLSSFNISRVIFRVSWRPAQPPPPPNRTDLKLIWTDAVAANQRFYVRTVVVAQVVDHRATVTNVVGSYPSVSQVTFFLFFLRLRIYSKLTKLLHCELIHQMSYNSGKS